MLHEWCSHHEKWFLNWPFEFRERADIAENVEFNLAHEKQLNVERRNAADDETTFRRFNDAVDKKENAERRARDQYFAVEGYFCHLVSNLDNVGQRTLTVGGMITIELIPSLTGLKSLVSAHTNSNKFSCLAKSHPVRLYCGWVIFVFGNSNRYAIETSWTV